MPRQAGRVSGSERGKPASAEPRASEDTAACFTYRVLSAVSIQTLRTQTQTLAGAVLREQTNGPQAKAIEDRRRRMAAIKAKHQAAKAVSEPTATALAAAAEGADPAQPSAAATTPAVSGPQETPETLADQPTPDRPGMRLSTRMAWTL